jgi:hypothetical protein
MLVACCFSFLQQTRLQLRSAVLRHQMTSEIIPYVTPLSLISAARLARLALFLLRLHDLAARPDDIN